MNYRISPRPWRVEMDYVLDATGEHILRSLPQENPDGSEDQERARFQLQLAATAPELLAACYAVKAAMASGNYAGAFASVDQAIEHATTIDFQDGNLMYRQLAHDKLHNAK